jgi:integrase
MPVVALGKVESSAGKLVAATEKSVAALPFNSGTWRVEGVKGLFVRCRATTKSFFIERRVQGSLVKVTLGELPVKQALEEAMQEWSKLKTKPTSDKSVTLQNAVDRYIEEKSLAPKTVENYRYNVERYLGAWKNRKLHDVGNDRAGFRHLHSRILKRHGPATANQVLRLVSAVYRWARKIDVKLPEPPTSAVEIEAIPARDWAYSPDELKAWWSATKKEKTGEVVKLGVSTLGTLKRTWWLTALFTGARKSSIEALRWADLDLDKKTIKFRVTKGDRPYSIPMSDTLAALLGRYRKSDDVPPSEWLFPSPSIDGAHLIDVKNPNEGIGPAHRLRHTFRTTLAQLGISSDQSRLMMGHSMGGDVSRGYITEALVVESLRPITNAVAARYLEILGADALL